MNIVSDIEATGRKDMILIISIVKFWGVPFFRVVVVTELTITG